MRRRAAAATLALCLGYAALTGAIVVAHRAPATGYELSIYRATPIAFWAGVAVALAVAFLVGGPFRARGTRRAAAFALATLTSVTVVSLPILRGYQFYGAGDSLTHYGWTTDIAAGVMDPVDLLYPGVHTSALVLRDALGVPTRLALMLTVPILACCFLAFVPRCVAFLAPVDGARFVGTFAAVLMLPINDVSVFLMVHPSSQVLLFLPVVLYLALRYLSTSATRRWRPTPVGAMLALASTAIVFLHPQQALNLVLVFGAIVAVQLVARWRWVTDVSRHRSMAGQAGYLLAVWLAWAPWHPRTRSVSTVVVDNLFGGTTGAGTVSTHGTSVAALGGSLVELFCKLFLPSLVFCGLAAAVMAATLHPRYYDRLPERADLAQYLTVAMLPLALAFLTFSIAMSGEQRFRYLGFVMVPILVLGAVAVAHGARRLVRRSSLGGWAAVSLLFALLLPLSLATYFLAPFIYQPNSQVTEQQLTGYQEVFADQDRDVPLLGISGGGRYADAIYGTERVDRGAVDVPGLDAVVPPPVLATNLTTHYDTDRYLVVTDADYAVEEELYDGLRYPRGSIAGVAATRGIDRVRANGGLRVYYVRASDATARGTPSGAA